MQYPNAKAMKAKRSKYNKQKTYKRKSNKPKCITKKCNKLTSSKIATHKQMHAIMWNHTQPMALVLLFFAVFFNILDCLFQLTESSCSLIEFCIICEYHWSATQISLFLSQQFTRQSKKVIYLLFSCKHKS